LQIILQTPNFAQRETGLSQEMALGMWSDLGYCIEKKLWWVRRRVTNSSWITWDFPSFST
jgi:hypothetical protein